MGILFNIWPTSVEGWVGLILMFLGLIGSIAALIPTAIKLFKALKEIVKNKNWQKILELADNAMELAEITSLHGSDKRDLVINTVRKGCSELDIELNEELVENLIKYIDESIQWLNRMNNSKEWGGGGC